MTRSVSCRYLSCAIQANALLDGVVVEFCRELLAERVQFERELTRRRFRTLLTDEKRNQIVSETVGEMTRELMRREVSRFEAVQEEREILVNETLYEVLREMVHEEHEELKTHLNRERIEHALSGSWISRQFKYDDLSLAGRETLVSHKLTERNTFEKISRSSIASIDMAPGDTTIVQRWWDEVHVQRKTNPFSIASILAKPDTAKMPTPKKTPTATLSTPTVHQPRRSSVLDDIIFLQKTLQKSVLGAGASSACLAKTPGGTAPITPNPLTPGKAFPRTPATPTVKDYRSDFEKKVLKNNALSLADHLTPDQATPLTPPILHKLKLVNPLPSTSFLSQPNTSGPITVTAPSVAKKISLLDLPMPSLLPSSSSSYSPSKTTIKVKRRKKDYLSSAYQDLDQVTGDSNYRKFLASRSPLQITRLPSLCRQRHQVEHAASDIKTVDNYR